MSLILKYQGRSLSQTKNQRTYIETYSGFQNEIDSVKVNGDTPTIGVFVQGKGYLTGIYKRPQQGSLWQLELQYSLSFEGLISTGSSTVVGVKSATLSSRTLQLPLQKLSTYLTKWNHYLSSPIVGVGLPLWYDTAKTTFVPQSDQDQYVWKDTLAECQFTDNQGVQWYCVAQPTKPGLDFFQFEYYVVTEKAKYNTASSAGSALQKNLNKIVTPSNTFGLTGGNWKLSGGEIQFDGKCWITTNTYQHSPTGWDTDLYGNNVTILGNGSNNVNQ